MSRKRANKVIVMTGGGSGGHLTPIQAVAHALNDTSPGFKIVFVGQKGDRLAKILHNDPVFSSVHSVYAGKLRRYHGEGIKQLLDISTQVKNTRDVFLVVIGVVQAWFLLGRLRPAAIFCKGGFVSVPVGIAAALRRIPYVTHDSDSVPGLANRMIAKWAEVHAVALPAEIYPYPVAKTVTVGVPLQSQFQFVRSADMLQARLKLGIPESAQLLFVIGGGLGAHRVNQAILTQVNQLFGGLKSLYIVHIAGLASEQMVAAEYDKLLTPLQRKRVQVYGFTTDVAIFSAAANIVVTRAGATNLAEFAMQGKACIIVPNPQLTGGHQNKNAEVYAQRDAAVVVPENNIEQLAHQIILLMNDPVRQGELGNNITQFTNKDAAKSLANVILTIATHKK